MKSIFLLPPSEWKEASNLFYTEELSFTFDKPISIAVNATEKDLKCKWARFKEGIELNSSLDSQMTNLARNRYSWVVFNEIGYETMTEFWKKRFDEHFYMLSWMYGIVRPMDKIANYKLPIEVKWLYAFWGGKITNALKEIDCDKIYSLLPNSYLKMINIEALWKDFVEVNFLHEKDWKIQKISHWSKKLKWEFVRNICLWNINLDYFENYKTGKNRYEIRIIK